MFSRYVFRADIAYDWEVKVDDLDSDTTTFKDDHLYEFGRKNARLRFSYAPQPPSDIDTQTEIEYLEELKKFNQRSRYIEGLHVNSTYTSIAQLWLIQKMVRAKEWRFVTDDDNSLMTAIFRVFSKGVVDGYAHHFICKIDRNKSLQETRGSEKWTARRTFPTTTMKLSQT